jgi:hypothetical protein
MAHAVLAQRKAIALKRLALEVLEVEPRAAPLANTVLHAVDEWVALAAGSHDDLDVFLGAAVEEIERRLGQASGQALATQVTGLLRQAQQRIRCQVCADAVGLQRCRVGSDNELLVEQRGDCLTNLKELFSYAHDLAVACYAKALAGRDRGVVALSTEWLAHDHEAEQFPIAGKTSFGLLGEQPVARVRLQLCVATLHAHAHFADLYVLVHECVAHAFQRFQAPPEERTVSAEDPFTEGWMDHVAVLALTRAAQESPVGQPDLLQRRLMAAERYRELRMDASQRTTARGQACAQAVYLGTRAAQDAFDLVRANTEDWNEASQAFLDLSCGWSARGLSADEVDALVTVVPKMKPNKFQDGSLTTEGSRLFARYCVDRDGDVVLARIVNLYEAL